MTTPVITGSWSQTSTALCTGAQGGDKIPIRWATDTVVYCYDRMIGLFVSVDAGVSWHKIWGIPNNNDSDGHFAIDGNDVSGGTVYVSTTSGANAGVWKLVGANSATKTVEAATITKTQIFKPSSVAFVSPGPIVWRGGFLYATERGTTNVNTGPPLINIYRLDTTVAGSVMSVYGDSYYPRAAQKLNSMDVSSTGKLYLSMRGGGVLIGDPPPTSLPNQVGAFTELMVKSSTVDGTTFSFTVPVAPAANSLDLIAVLSSQALITDFGPSALSGCGMIWDPIAMVPWDTNASPSKFLALYRTMGPSPTTDPINVTFQSAQTGCEVYLAQITGRKTTGVRGADAVRQVKTGFSNPDGALTVTFNSAPDAGGKSCIVGFAARPKNPFTGSAEAGWTLVEDGGYATPAMGLAVSVDDQSTDQSFTVTEL